MQDHKYLLLATAAVISVLIAGCTTLVTSEKLSSNSEGIPYCLSAQAITFERSESGKVGFTVLDDLPDEQRLYVVRASAFLADYDFEVRHRGVSGTDSEIKSRDMGSCLLDSVSLHNTVPDDALTAFKDAADKVGNAALGQIEQKHSADAKALEDKKNKQKLIDEELRKRDRAVNDAKARLAKLEKDKAKGDQSVTDEEIIAAKKSLREAELARESARRAANDGFVPSSTGESVNEEPRDKNIDVKQTADTPAFYFIRQSLDAVGPTVELVPMNYQESSTNRTGAQIQFPAH